MQAIRIVRVLFIAGILLMPGLSVAEELVKATGVSFFEPGREVIAREKALEDAKRNAIEKAFGANVQSRTQVENFQVVKDQIFSRSSGYLRRYEIVDEKKTEFGTYEVTIEAEVELSALVDDIDRFREILSWQQNPRIAVRLEEGLKPKYLAAAQKVSNLMIDRLKREGFRVYRADAAKKIRMGLILGISLDLNTRTSSYQGIDISLNEVDLSANIYRPGDGEILAAAGAVETVPGENRLKALDTGSRKCVDSIFTDLRRKLIRVWEKELLSEREISLVMKNISDVSEAKEIGGILQSDVSGTKAVQLLSFNNGTAEYLVRYRGWPDQLVNELQMSYFKKRYFEISIEGLEGNRIIMLKK